MLRKKGKKRDKKTPKDARTFAEMINASAAIRARLIKKFQEAIAEAVADAERAIADRRKGGAK